jgi:hypothetical protein
VVTVIDTTEPGLIGVPGDITVECDSIPEPATPTAIDNCDPDPTVEFFEARIDGPCEDIYTLTRTWTATDSCDNASSGMQVIMVVDTTTPMILGVPEDDQVECDEVAEPASPNAVDNCDPEPGLFFEETRLAGPCEDTYDLTRTWTAIDRCGHLAAETQMIEVSDVTPPDLTCDFELVEDPYQQDEGNDEFYAVRYDGFDNCDTDVEVNGFLNVYGTDESCDEDPDFIGYPVQDGDLVEFRCSRKASCLFLTDEDSDADQGAVIKIRGPAMKLYVEGEDNCDNNVETECYHICPDPKKCLTSLTLQNIAGEEEIFYWFQFSKKRTLFEVGGEVGSFDTSCSTCLEIGDTSDTGLLAILAIDPGKRMNAVCHREDENGDVDP